MNPPTDIEKHDYSNKSPTFDLPDNPGRSGHPTVTRTMSIRSLNELSRSVPARVPVEFRTLSVQVNSIENNPGETHIPHGKRKGRSSAAKGKIPRRISVC